MSSSRSIRRRLDVPPVNPDPSSESEEYNEEEEEESEEEMVEEEVEEVDLGFF